MPKSHATRRDERLAKERASSGKDISRVYPGTRIYCLRWWRTLGVVPARVVELRANGATRVDMGVDWTGKCGRYVWLRPQDWQPNRLKARAAAVMAAMSARKAAVTIVSQLDRVIAHESAALTRSKLALERLRKERARYQKELGRADEGGEDVEGT